MNVVLNAYSIMVGKYEGKRTRKT